VNGELWQFAAAGVALAVVVALWLLFVYKPRRTGEGNPRNVHPDHEPPKDTDGNP
jgi:hypothetical protein